MTNEPKTLVQVLTETELQRGQRRFEGYAVMTNEAKTLEQILTETHGQYAFITLLRKEVHKKLTRLLRKLYMDPNTIFIPKQYEVEVTLELRSQVHYPGVPSPHLKLEQFNVLFVQNLECIKVGYIDD